jgi:hypothetical protein
MKINIGVTTMRDMSIFMAAKLVEGNAGLFGWKGGGHFDAWVDEYGINISVDTGKTFEKKNIKKIKALFSAAEMTFIEKGETGPGGKAALVITLR